MIGDALRRGRGASGEGDTGDSGEEPGGGERKGEAEADIEPEGRPREVEARLEEASVPLITKSIDRSRWHAARNCRGRSAIKKES